MRVLPIAILAAVLAVLPSARAEVRSRPGPESGKDRQPSPALAPSLADLPPYFEANRGQADPAVKFLSRPRGFRAFFTDDEAVFVLPRGTGGTADPAPGALPPDIVADVARLRFPGARSCAPEGVGTLPGVSNYFLGNDPSRWVTDAPHVSAITRRDLWPGIDLRWNPGRRRGLEFSFLVRPGADPSPIALEFRGGGSPSVEGTGDLRLDMPGGLLRCSRPVAFQESGGRRRSVPCGFVPGPGGEVRFALGAVDPSLPLVIDPEVEYSSYIRGSSDDKPTAVQSDAAGAYYVAGWTWSTNFPTKTPYQAAHKGGLYDGFVMKVARRGTALVYATYIGGAASADLLNGLAVDSSGAALVCGFSFSADYPTMLPLQASHNGGNDEGIYSKLSPSGSSLVYSSFLGGSGSEGIRAVVLDGSGAPIFTGYTQSSDFPLNNPLQSAFGGATDVFVTKLTPSGNAYAWSTLFGGGGADDGTGVALDSDGSVYVAGNTESTNFPLKDAYQGSRKNLRDTFLFKLAADGQTLGYSTYLGGTGDDFTYGVGVGPDGSAWVAGSTFSSDFPLANPIRSTFAGGNEAFVTKFAAGGSTLTASTYLGGGDYDGANGGIAVASDGTAYVTGYTESADFPVLNAVQGSKAQYQDIFVTAIRPAGTSLLWSTFWGGSSNETPYAISVGLSRAVLVAGTTSSMDFPTLNPLQGPPSTTTLHGFMIAFVGPPLVPTDCEAGLTGLTRIGVSWKDNSDDETGFTLERKVGAGAFSTLATLPPGTTSYEDAGLAPSADYTYRVRAFNDLGTSIPSNEDTVTTPPIPVTAPAAPTGMVATVVAPRRVDLSWTDNSTDEDFFLLSRATGSSLFSTLATPNLGVVAWTDGTVLPGRSYSYKVRAQNPLGASLDSNTETVTMPSTLTPVLAKGVIADHAAFGRDSVKLAGTLAFGPEALAAILDPASMAISVRLGNISAPALVDVPAASEGWTLRRGKWTWKSPKGSITKAKVVVIPATGAWTVALSRLTLAPAPTNPVRLTLTAGTDEGHQDTDWTGATKAGTIRFPVPVPK